MKDIIARLAEYIAPKQTTIADSEIETVENGLQRLQDLADYHQRLANQYRAGVNRIRGGYTVKIESTKGDSTVQEEILRGLNRGGVMPARTLSALSKEA